MTEIRHVMAKIKGQETYFEGQSYPYYTIGWMKDEDLHDWNGFIHKSHEIEDIREI